jgi:hypothetical protein
MATRIRVTHKVLGIGDLRRPIWAGRLRGVGRARAKCRRSATSVLAIRRKPQSQRHLGMLPLGNMPFAESTWAIVQPPDHMCHGRLARPCRGSVGVAHGWTSQPWHDRSGVGNSSATVRLGAAPIVCQTYRGTDGTQWRTGDRRPSRRGHKMRTCKPLWRQVPLAGPIVDQTYGGTVDPQWRQWGRSCGRRVLTP